MATTEEAPLSPLNEASHADSPSDESGYNEAEKKWIEERRLEDELRAQVRADEARQSGHTDQHVDATRWEPAFGIRHRADYTAEDSPWEKRVARKLAARQLEQEIYQTAHEAHQTATQTRFKAHRASRALVRAGMRAEEHVTRAEAGLEKHKARVAEYASRQAARRATEARKSIGGYGLALVNIEAPANSERFSFMLNPRRILSAINRAIENLDNKPPGYMGGSDNPRIV